MPPEEGSNKQLVWEPPVQIKAPPDIILGYREKFKVLTHILTLSHTGSANKIFLTGLNVLLNDPEIAAQVDAHDLAIAKAYGNALAIKTDVKRLQTIFEETFLGDREAFTEWCTDQGIADELVQRVVGVLAADFPTMPEYKRRMLVWLEEELADGQKHSVEEIKRRAQEEGLLPVFERDWGRMREIASKHGWTSQERGMWAKPKSTAEGTN